MYKLLYFLPLFLFAACDLKPKSVEELLSRPIMEADSLKYMSLLLEDMESERMEFVERVQETCGYKSGLFCVLEIRCVLSIRVNSQDQIMVRDEITDKITERLFEYYAYNMEENDVTSNFPLYSRIDHSSIENSLNARQEEYQLVLKEDETDQQSEMLEFIGEMISYWKRKKRVVETLNSSTLPEPSSNCVVKIECQNVEKHKERLLNDAMEGFYLLRDLRAQEYFQESYVSIYRRATLLKKQEDFDKLEALQELHAIRLISNDEDCDVVIPPPPQILD